MPILALEISDDGWEVLEEIREKIGAKDAAEVVANAIRLYDGVVGLGDPNAMMRAKRPDGTTAIVRLFE